jgi:hypothetical protein
MMIKQKILRSKREMGETYKPSTESEGDLDGEIEQIENFE